jgi:CheY-like chemotaxis protein
MPLSKILLVDDSDQFRRIISRTLQQREEFDVIEASDGWEAVQKAERLQPDFILLDIGLPKLNGIEAGRRIQTLCPETKIVFLSQESSPGVSRGPARPDRLSRQGDKARASPRCYLR